MTIKQWMATDQFVVLINIIRIVTFVGIGILIYIMVKNIEAVKLLAYDPCEICMNKTGAICFKASQTQEIDEEKQLLTQQIQQMQFRESMNNEVDFRIALLRTLSSLVEVVRESNKQVNQVGKQIHSLVEQTQFQNQQSSKKSKD